MSNNSVMDNEIQSGSCRACDTHGPLNDLGLCKDCVEKLERDLIRLRDWDSSVTVFGLSREKREAKRDEIIAQSGEKLELLAAPDKDKSRPRRTAKKKPKRRKSAN